MWFTMTTGESTKMNNFNKGSEKMGKSKVSVKKDNRGVSAIEMVVVMAILVVLATSAFSAMTFLSRSDIKKASKTLYSAITSCRTSSMARSGYWCFAVYQDASGCFVLDSVQGDTLDETTGTYGTAIVHDHEVLSNKVSSIQANIVYANGTETGYVDLKSITFKKNTGAVEEINSVTTTESGGSRVYTVGTGVDAKSGGYADIKITISENERVMRLYFITGEVEQLN